jgi:hypothetical protein
MPHPGKMRKPIFTEKVAEAIPQKARSHRFLYNMLKKTAGTRTPE